MWRDVLAIMVLICFLVDIAILVLVVSNFWKMVSLISLITLLFISYVISSILEKAEEKERGGDDD